MANFDNPYTPVGGLPQTHARPFQLASLGKRFLGFLADSFIPLIAMIPGYGAMFVDGDFTQPEPQLGPIGMLGIGWLVVFGIAMFVVQIYLLVTRSQTIGKYLVKTQINDVETNQPAGFVKAGVLRLFVNGLIAAIPCIGTIYAITDICFIFREDRRCIHDLIAGTHVVDIS